MRILMKAQLPADPGRDVPPATRLETIRRVLDALKPEAVYFYPEHGVRTTIAVFDLKASSELPSIAEPFFRQGAKVEFFPVMTIEDLQAGLKKLEVGVAV
jgi:hypothetical protein